MRASREIRMWVNRMRRKWGNKSGVIRGALVDCPEYERKHAKSIRQRRRGYKGT